MYYKVKPRLKNDQLVYGSRNGNQGNLRRQGHIGNAKVHDHPHGGTGKVHDHQHLAIGKVHDHQHGGMGKIHDHQHSIASRLKEHIKTDGDTHSCNHHYTGMGSDIEWGYMYVSWDEKDENGKVIRSNCNPILFINNTNLHPGRGEKDRDVYFQIKSIPVRVNGLEVDVDVAYNFSYAPYDPVYPVLPGGKPPSKFPTSPKKQLKQFEKIINEALEEFKKYFETEAYDKLNDINHCGLKESKCYEPLVKMLEKYQTQFKEDYIFVKNQINYAEDIYFLEYDRKVRLALAWSDFTNDKEGKITPLGPELYSIGEELNHQSIGIIDALIKLKSADDHELPIEDKEGHHKNGKKKPSEWEDLNRAQLMLLSVYDRFKQFCTDKGPNYIDQYLLEDFATPPLVKLINGASGTWAADRDDVPTIIAVNRTKARDDKQKIRVQAYAALPHELGHDIADTFKNDYLIDELRCEIRKNDNIKRPCLWNAWMSELFADAIGVSGLGIASVIGLSELLKEINEPPDLIRSSAGQPQINQGVDNESWFICPERSEKEKAKEQNYDVHPNSYLRIEFAMRLFQLRKGTPNDELKAIQKEWEEKINQFDSFKDQLADNTIPISDLLKEVGVVAESILGSKLESLAGQTVSQLLDKIYDERFKCLARNFVDVLGY